MALTDQIPAPKEPQKADCPSAPCSPILALLTRLPIGERLQAGDWWYYKSLDCWTQLHSAPRNFIGMRQKITPHHLPFYRVTGLRNFKENDRTLATQPAPQDSDSK